MALASEHSLEAVLLRIVELAVELTGAVRGPRRARAGRRAIEEFITVGISTEAREAIGDPPVGHGLLGALITDAAAPDPGHLSGSAIVGFPPNHPPMTSLLGVPVLGRGSVFGNLYLTDKGGPTPSMRRTNASS